MRGDRVTASPRTIPTPNRTAVLRRRVKIIVAVTIGYNLIEGIIALAAGTEAASAALIGFGLDSGVEVGTAEGLGDSCATAVGEIMESAARDTHRHEGEGHS